MIVAAQLLLLLVPMFELLFEAHERTNGFQAVEATEAADVVRATMLECGDGAASVETIHAAGALLPLARAVDAAWWGATDLDAAVPALRAIARGMSELTIREIPDWNTETSERTRRLVSNSLIMMDARGIAACIGAMRRLAAGIDAGKHGVRTQADAAAVFRAAAAFDPTKKASSWTQDVADIYQEVDRDRMQHSLLRLRMRYEQIAIDYDDLQEACEEAVSHLCVVFLTKRAMIIL